MRTPGRLLTAKQRAILAFIRGYSTAHGYAPTLREIADSIGVTSLATVHQHLCLLRAKGAVTWQAGLPRTVQVTSEEALP